MFPKIPRAVIEVVTITSWSDIVNSVSNTFSETVAVERKYDFVSRADIACQSLLEAIPLTHCDDGDGSNAEPEHEDVNWCLGHIALPRHKAVGRILILFSLFRSCEEA